MSRPGLCSPGPKPSVHSSRPQPGGIVIVTYGENYGAADCGVPLNGTRSLKTRQPVDLELWPACYTPMAAFLTTVGNYRQAGNDVEYGGDVKRASEEPVSNPRPDRPGTIRRRPRLLPIPCPSLSGRIWFRHSCRRLRTTCSPVAFARGD
jgi:hypothetical protein